MTQQLCTARRDRYRPLDCFYRAAGELLDRSVIDLISRNCRGKCRRGRGDGGIGNGETRR